VKAERKEFSTNLLTRACRSRGFALERLNLRKFFRTQSSSSQIIVTTIHDAIDSNVEEVYTVPKSFYKSLKLLVSVWMLVNLLI